MSMGLHEAGKKAPQIEIEKVLHLTDSCMAMEMHIPAGAMLGKHLHNYSHLAFLMEGEAILHKGSEKLSVTGPAILEIEANVWHAVEAITDVRWACAHGASEKDLTLYE
jgi:quercetin dioxygenase-like cupin family protein